MLFGPRLAPLLVSRGPEWDGGKVGATVSGNSPSFRFPGSRRRSCVCLTPNGEVGGPPDTLAHAPLAAMRSSGPPRGRGAVSQACRPVPLTETRAWGGPDRLLPASPRKSHIVLRVQQRARGFGPVNVASRCPPSV